MGKFSSQNLLHTATYVLGQRWTVQILEILAEKPTRFTELRNHLSIKKSNISSRILANRLYLLQDLKLVASKLISKNHTRVTYSLTDLGQSFYHTTDEIAAWTVLNEKTLESWKKILI
jgi:DNA-binding HxlR family transcriptional regulator